MNLNELLEISKKKSEARLREIREQLTIPFFRTKDQSLWNGASRNIVVVGSGIGGMASGALFAKIGHKVTVLELNDNLIGGHGRCVSHGDLKFSMGPQYVWEFGDGQIGDRFLRFLGLKESNPFLPMQRDGFERIFIGGQKNSKNYCCVNFRVPLGLNPFRWELIALFPEEKDAIHSLFDDMIDIFDVYKSYFRRHYATEGRFLLATKFLLTSRVNMETKIKLGRSISMSVKDLFDQHRISPLVRRILYGHGGIFAESESDMSAIAYIVGTGNYHAGAWYPKNGFYHFFNSLASVIQSSGGSVETGKRVVRLKTEAGIVTKAVCADGSVYNCDFLFSDISPRLTAKLLGQESEDFDYNPSHSIPTCCIGVKGGLPAIADMKGRNYWWQDGNEVNYTAPDITRPPRMLFIGSPTANGFGREIETEDDGLVIFCPGNYDQEKQIYEKGPEAVKSYKQRLAADIVDILENHVFPGIHSRLAFAEIISSIDIERDTGGESGNAYGRRLTADEILKGPIKEENCPANLYNVSATKNSPGIAAGIFTAELIFEELTGQAI
ncbi:MAG: NAD(P)/FAD-dependent oxidoreductase [Desulfobacteraceae bacterium]|nr:MAG: NAD(P)/FAD-dependent oxidoreductase [Desulfobacteraceae bacterium]